MQFELICKYSLYTGLILLLVEPFATSDPRAEDRRERLHASLDRRVVVGYQGWFNCEGDGAELGWTHWTRRRNEPFGPGNVTIDLWPDVSEFDDDELFETGFRHEDGRAAKVFSSNNAKTVDRHFQWMKEYGIDAAFLQRFANGLGRGRNKQHKDKVLANVRSAASKHGRAYAVMYDLSGLPAGGCRIVREDWQALRSELDLTDDDAYQFHNGKPVVAVWGIGFQDGGKPREYTLAECRELIEFLKSDGCTVMIGTPTGWRGLERDSIKVPELHDVIQCADIISPWTVGRYRDPEGVQRHAKKYWEADVDWCSNHQLDYMPVVFPGFSWHNLKGDAIGAIPRLKGEFLWSQITSAKQAGAEMLYVAMFDEVDEGTAIFKCTNEPPVGSDVEFLTYDGLPSDYYLKLVGKAGRLLRDELSHD
ncbi:MAG: glycoside hydrolase family 71/99-like protein [Planctomycetota bacterium]